MFRKSFVNSCYFRHKFNKLLKIHFNDQDIKLPAVSRCFVTFAPYNFIKISVPYQKYSTKSNNEVVTLSPKTMLESYQLDPVTNEADAFVDLINRRASFKERCLNKISNALEFSHEESLKIYEEYPLLFRECIDSTIDKITFLTKLTISPKSIAKNVEILHHNCDELACRIDIMNEWGIQDEHKSDFVPFLILESVEFHKISALFKMERKRVPDGNRLIYFSKLLNCPLEIMVNHAMTHDHLIHRNFAELQEACNILLDAGISHQYIQNHLQIFINSVETLKKWVNLANGNQNYNCNKRDEYYFKLFRRLMEEEKFRRSILKSNKTKEEFLSEKLNMDVEVIKYLMRIHPQIFNRSLIDLNKVIDFLYSEGYTGDKICIAPSVLKKSIKLLQEHLAELRKIHGKNPPITVLSLSKYRYQQHIHALYGLNTD